MDEPTYSFDGRACSASHAKVRELDLAALSVENENVFRFDVPVDQFLTVQVVQRNGHLVHAALCHCLWETHLAGETQGDMSGEKKKKCTTDRQAAVDIKL